MARILIAEDEPHILKMLDLRLQDHGYEVICVKNGREALNKALTEIPDVVLLDVMMPVMNGFEVLAELKSRQETRDIPVLILTARGMEKDRGTGIEAGVVDYITKPVSFDVLIASIDRALEANSILKTE